jgi:hypothetical protein
LGRIANKSGDTIKRWLSPAEITLSIVAKIAQSMFSGATEITLSIDDTLLHKIYGNYMVGTGKFFDTKLGKRVNAFRLIVGALSNGKYTIPISFDYFFAKELLTNNEPAKTKLDFIKEFYANAQRILPGTKIRIAADGLFASIEFLEWAIQNNIECIVRMHSNRVVIFNLCRYNSSRLASLIPNE